MINVKIFVKGGVLGADELLKTAQIAFELQTLHFQFGARQEIIFRIPDDNEGLLAERLQGIQYEVSDDDEFVHHNIVCSSAATRIAPCTYWVKSSSYHDVLDQFTRPLRIRVNITDLRQDLVYSFTGDLNFIASEEVNFWHVFVRVPENKQQKMLPFLVHSDDIARLSYFFENIIPNTTSIDHVIEKLNKDFNDRWPKAGWQPRMKIPEFHNYEGLHKYEDKYWLGIYRRHLSFTFSQLSGISNLCKNQRIGRMHILPWKSLLIKDISEESLPDWKLLMSRYNLPNGHAQSELNWEINDFDTSALELKMYLRKQFISNDINSNSIILGINNSPDHSFSHIIIRKQKKWKIFGGYLLHRYDILYREDFNPTTSNFKLFDSGLSKHQLFRYLQELTYKYNDQTFRMDARFVPQEGERPKRITTTEKNKIQPHYVYQCTHCQTIYDPAYGEPEQNIPPKTEWIAVPEAFECPVCDAPKKDFEPLRKESSLAV